MATKKTEILTAQEFNGETKEFTERVITAEELADLEIYAQNLATQRAEIEAKAAARQSALAKFAELGLTEEEIAAL